MALERHAFRQPQRLNDFLGRMLQGEAGPFIIPVPDVNQSPLVIPLPLFVPVSPAIHDSVLSFAHQPGIWITPCSDKTVEFVGPPNIEAILRRNSLLLARKNISIPPTNAGHQPEKMRINAGRGTGREITRRLRHFVHRTG